jgi:hypothetical protein
MGWLCWALPQTPQQQRKGLVVGGAHTFHSAAAQRVGCWGVNGIPHLGVVAGFDFLAVVMR